MKWNDATQQYDNTDPSLLARAGNEIGGCLLLPVYLVVGLFGLLLMAVAKGWWLIALFLLAKALGVI